VIGEIDQGGCMRRLHLAHPVQTEVGGNLDRVREVLLLLFFRQVRKSKPGFPELRQQLIEYWIFLYMQREENA
jgi:hypothetical protein